MGRLRPVSHYVCVTMRCMSDPGEILDLANVGSWERARLTAATSPVALFELAGQTSKEPLGYRVELARWLPAAIDNALMHVSGPLGDYLTRIRHIDFEQDFDSDFDSALILANEIAGVLENLSFDPVRAEARDVAMHFARQLKTPAYDEGLLNTTLASDLAVTLSGDLGVDEQTAYLFQWVGTIIYGLVVLALTPAQPEEPAPQGVELLISPLVVVTAIDVDDVTGLHHNVEQLLSELTTVAHDPATPAELSLQATAHERDGRGLMYGVDGWPRELPPAPRMMYGWVVDAMEMIGRNKPVEEGDAARLLDQITSSHDNEPQGLRQALQAATTTNFVREATERARLGALDGVESGTQQLFERVIAHPVKTVASLTGFVTGVVTMVRNYPWLEAGLRALLRLVTKAPIH